MTEHTPGPWIKRPDVYSEMICITTETKMIAQLPGPDGTDIAEKEQLANAHLIAAAPDLLAALEQVQDWFAIHAELATRFPGGYHATRRCARAAIAKT